MKNNTKIRLHLSKQLFESLTKQVIAEAKGNMSGGAYTEAVKQPKGGKSQKNEDLSISKNEVPQVRKTGAGDPNAPKIGSKQQLSTALRQTGTDLAKDSKANIQAAESNEVFAILQRVIDIANDKDNSTTVFNRIKSVLDTIEKQRKGKVTEMETNVDEGEQATRGAKMAAEEFINAVAPLSPETLDPALQIMLLLSAAAASPLLVQPVQKLIAKIKGSIQGLKEDESAVSPEELKDLASKVGISI